MKERLLQATFKGAAFYWDSLSTQLGKDSISHRYPGSPRRFCEDMGRIPRVFTVEAVILGGENHYANKQALENALSSPGAGWLVHPTYGRVLCTAKPASCREDLKNVGQAKYTLKFERSFDEARPVDFAPSQRKIVKLSDSALDGISDSAADKYEVAVSPSFFDKAIEQINDLSDELIRANELVSPSTFNAGEVLGAINKFKRSASSLVTSPETMFNQLKAISRSLLTMDDLLIDRFNRLTGFFGESSNSPPGRKGPAPIPPFSYESKNAQNNNDLLNETTNLNTLVLAYRTVGIMEFKDQDSLDEAQQRLENQFANSLDAQLMKEPLRDSVIDLRNTANQLLQEKRLLTKKITVDEVKVPMSLNLILFMHTGSTEDSDYIQGLNLEQSQTFAEGEIKVIE